MNRELRDLLVECGYERAGLSEFRWHDVIVHRNIASIPPVPHGGGAMLWNHGFNLILLDGRGAPTHYAKCRPASAADTKHETAVLSALTADSALADIIPPTRIASSGPLSVQVSRYVGNRTWATDSTKRDVKSWTRGAREILAKVDRLARSAAVLLPTTYDQHILRPGAAVRPLLPALARLGLPSKSLAQLSAAAEAAPAIPARPQHGDLWPANLIARPDGGWWVLDFEMYGRIRMPLHDALHLVRTSASTASGGTWLHRLAADDDWAHAQQQVIGDAAAGSEVPGAAITAVAIYYLAEMTERLSRFGNPPSFWEPYVAELVDAVEYLNECGTLEGLLLGSRGGASTLGAELHRS